MPITLWFFDLGEVGSKQITFIGQMLDLSEVKGGSLSFFLQRLDLSEVRKSFYTGFVPDTINRKDH
jgi:hypothetical protein